jgi:hypothetical protein
VQILRTYVRQQDAEQLQVEMDTARADIAAIVPEVHERLPDLPPPARFENPEQTRFR